MSCLYGGLHTRNQGIFCLVDQLHNQISGSIDPYISTIVSEEVLLLVWRRCCEHCVNMQASIAGKDNIEL